MTTDKIKPSKTIFAVLPSTCIDKTIIFNRIYTFHKDWECVEQHEDYGIYTSDEKSYTMVRYFRVGGRTPGLRCDEIKISEHISIDNGCDAIWLTHFFCRLQPTPKGESKNEHKEHS